MTSTLDRVVKIFRQYATFGVSRDGPPHGGPSGEACLAERRSGLGTQPLSLTARSANTASSLFFSFSVAGATGLPVASLIAAITSGRRCD
jgi:hypothetical protein